MADDAVAIQDLLSIIANLQAINTTLQALQTIPPDVRGVIQNNG